MPMPHTTQLQLIKKQLKGLEGKQKINTINRILEELPTYSSGPYADIRKWLHGQIAVTKTRSRVKHQDWLGVKKEGSRQFVLVGKPSAGKSSLLNALSGRDVKVAAYAFTTLKPIPAIVDINGADIQIVDLPGLIEGAHEDAGGGKRLLGIVRHSDGILLMHDLTKPFAETATLLRELELAEIDKPLIVVGNKLDLAPDAVGELTSRFPHCPVVGISVRENHGLEALRQTIWQHSSLIRVYVPDGEPVILSEGASVHDFAKRIHKKLVVREARVSGPSAKFPNQRVGLDHILHDGDTVALKAT